MNFDVLKSREQAVRRQGTGLSGSDLLGCWTLQTVWSKGNQKANAFSGWMLRNLNARLEIREGSQVRGRNLHLCNAINLGPIELKFEGPGSLQGKRPLLVFHFESLSVSIAGVGLITKELPTPPPQRAPFFALIERNTDGWLAARGRGGGLALWRLKD